MGVFLACARALAFYLIDNPPSVVKSYEICKVSTVETANNVSPAR